MCLWKLEDSDLSLPSEVWLACPKQVAVTSALEFCVVLIRYSKNNSSLSVVVRNLCPAYNMKQALQMVHWLYMNHLCYFRSFGGESGIIKMTPGHLLREDLLSCSLALGVYLPFQLPKRT